MLTTCDDHVGSNGHDLGLPTSTFVGEFLVSFVERVFLSSPRWIAKRERLTEIAGRLIEMEAMQILVSPRMLCPCGKSFLPMSAEERKAYDEAVRRIEDQRSRAGKNDNTANARATSYETDCH